MVPEQVQAGVTFLDERFGPYWFELVNLDRLDLTSGCDCVAAQVIVQEGDHASAWGNAMYEWGITKPEDPECDPELVTIDHDRARALGFEASDYAEVNEWELFEKGWRRVIEGRIAERDPVPA